MMLQRILLICLAVTTAGVLQVFWLKSALSQRFTGPVDMGGRLRGRRIFGDNKTWRGFLGMVPACALSFAAWSRLLPAWELSALGYLGLGAACGLGFMAGELPNSFIKRQLDIAPGTAPNSPSGAASAGSWTASTPSWAACSPSHSWCP